MNKIIIVIVIILLVITPVSIFQRTTDHQVKTEVSAHSFSKHEDIMIDTYCEESQASEFDKTRSETVRVSIMQSNIPDSININESYFGSQNHNPTELEDFFSIRDILYKNNKVKCYVRITYDTDRQTEESLLEGFKGRNLTSIKYNFENMDMDIKHVPDTKKTYSHDLSGYVEISFIFVNHRYLYFIFGGISIIGLFVYYYTKNNRNSS